MSRANGFEAEVARRARELVAASPAMLAEYKRLHTWNVWHSVGRYVVASFLAAIGLLMAPVSFFFPAFIPLVARFSGTSPAGAPLATSLALGAQSLVIAALASMAFTMHAGRMFCSPTHLAALAHFPVSDRQLLKRALWEWRWYLAYYLYVLVLLYAPLAWREGLNWSQACGLGLLLVLQCWHLISLAVILAHRIRRQVSVILFGLSLAFGFYFGSMLLCLLIAAPAEQQHWGALPALLLPTGWINGAIYYGVIRGSLAGWLFLLPVAVTSAYAAWWLRRGYAIREVRVSPLGTVTPVFEYGFPNTPGAEDEPIAADEDSPSPASTASVPESQQLIEKRLQSSPALAPPDWSRRGLIERWIGALLTERERTLLEQFYHGPPLWTTTWVTCTVLTVAFALLFLLFGRSIPSGGLLPFANVVLFVTVALGESLPYVRRLDSRGSGTPSLHPAFPVGLSEMLSALTKSLWLRAISYVPLLGMWAIALEWRRIDGWACATAVVAAALLQMGVVHLIAARSRFAALGGRRMHWRRWFALGLLTITFSLFLPLLFYIHWAVTLGLAVLTLLFAWLACRQFDLLYTRTEFDFSLANPLALQHRKQKSLDDW